MILPITVRSGTIPNGSLGAAAGHPEPGDHLIEDQHRPGPGGRLPQEFEVALLRRHDSHVGRHGFGKSAATLCFSGPRPPPRGHSRDDHGAGCLGFRNSRAGRNAVGRDPRPASANNRQVAVVGAGELDQHLDPWPPGPAGPPSSRPRFPELVMRIISTEGIRSATSSASSTSSSVAAPKLVPRRPPPRSPPGPRGRRPRIIGPQELTPVEIAAALPVEHASPRDSMNGVDPDLAHRPDR